MKLLIRLIPMIFFILTACSSQNKIIEHRKPDLHVDYSYFEEHDCFGFPGCPTDLPQNTGLNMLIVEKPSEYLGGLDPAIPIVSAQTYDFGHDPTIPAVYTTTCAATMYQSYFIRVDEEIRLLDSIEDLAAAFAPIESKKEALGYTVAATGYHPVYDLESIENIELRRSRIEETYVKRIPSGFVVHLFDYFLCHCGPQIIKSVEVTVTRDGKITISEPVDAYRDPRFDNVCFD